MFSAANSSSNKRNGNKATVPFGSIATLVLETFIKASVTVLTGFAIRKLAYMWFYDPHCQPQQAQTASIKVGGYQLVLTDEEYANREQATTATPTNFVDSLSETCYNLSSKVIRWLKK